ncbi:MAG: response regulator [Campylobacterales bacterium]|nr:response regulator [Campylobacterales bacterium]
MKSVQELKNISKNISIIYAEDEDKLREKFEKYLSNFFEDIRAVSDGQKALDVYKERACDIVITDIRMPNLNGIDLIKKIKEINPAQDIIITSAYTESDYLIDSIKLGVGSYIVKPFQNDQMLDTLYQLVSKINETKENRLYHQHLEELVEKEIKKREAIQIEQIDNYEQTLIALIDLIERRDSYTAGHSQRVADYSRMIAKEMKYSDEDCNLIYRAGILHDIGKVATPDSILLKPGKLNEIEYKLIQEHVSVGFDMLNKIPMFKIISNIINSHHERYDGKGYPKGLKGEEINELSQIMIVADSFDAMTTSRIYKSRKNLSEALEELQKLSNIQFHEKVVESAVKVLSKVVLKESATQLPESELEHERFVYFFNDRVTELFNQDYLNIVFIKNSISNVYKYVDIVFLHNFKEYNAKYGWEMGNQLLFDFAKLLKEMFPNSLLFRIHANDFVILSSDSQEIDLTLIPYHDIFNKEKITTSLKHLDIEDGQMLNIAMMEKN